MRSPTLCRPSAAAGGRGSDRSDRRWPMRRPSGKRPQRPTSPSLDYRALGSGLEPVRRLGRGRRHGAPVDPIWILLFGRLFGLESFDSRDWKSLDFLGFSRPNRDLSMGCVGFSRKIFREAFPGVERAPPAERGVEAMRSAKIGHEMERNSISAFPQSIVGPYSTTC